MKIKHLVCVLFAGLSGQLFAQFQPWQWPFIAYTRPYSPEVMWVDPQSNFLYVGGDYDSIAGIAGHSVSRFDGTNWWPMGQGFGGVPLPHVTSFEFYNGIIAAGDFTSSGSVPVDHLGIWNGTQWLPLGGGVNGIVSSLCVYNGELYAGGSFTMAGNVPVTNFAKWNGTTWSGVGNFSGYVGTMAVYNGKLYFTSSSTVFEWNGSTLTPIASLSMNQGFAFAICMKVWNNELYVSGQFDQVNSVPANFIARYDGTNWSDLAGVNFNYNIYPVVDMEPFGNKLLVTGGLDSVNNLSGHGFAIWDGNGWTTTGSGPFYGNAIRVFKGDIYAAQRNGVMKCDSALSSVQEILPNRAVIFPDPARDHISISLPENFKIISVNIYDLAGKKVWANRTSPGNRYEIGDLEPGIYFIEAIAENQERFTGKLVKE